MLVIIFNTTSIALLPARGTFQTCVTPVATILLSPNKYWKKTLSVGEGKESSSAPSQLILL